MAFTTKPRGIHANFTVDCPDCRGEIVYRDGRQDRHECRERIDLDDIQFPEPNHPSRPPRRLFRT